MTAPDPAARRTRDAWPRTLETARLVLRPWREQDAETAFPYMHDPAVGPRAGWPAHRTVEESRRIVREVLAVPENYAITLKRLAPFDLPIGTIVLALENLCQPISNWLLTFIPKFAQKGESGKLLGLHWVIGTWAQPLYFIVHFCAIYFGSDAVAWIVGVVPEFVLNGFAAGANILPVMGFAMLARMILTKRLLPFYFLGFLLTAYIGVPVLGVALLSIIIGIEYTGIMKPKAAAPALEGDDDDF